MATIDVRHDRTGRPQYRARVRLLGSPPYSATFDRKADAIQWARQVESDLKRGRHVPTTDAMRRTVADMIDRYLEETLPNKRRNRDRVNVEKRLAWWKANLGEYRLANVTPALVAEHREKLAREPTRNGPNKKPSTINRYLAALSHAFTTAVREWGWLTDSPMRNVARREEPGGRTRFLSDAERLRLLKACQESRNPDLHTVVVLALSTGARAGELMHLTWDDVDLNRGRLIFRETKNREIRGVPLVGLALDIMRDRAKVRRIDSRLVFPGRNPRRPVHIKTAWRAAVARAELEDFRFHDLRHTAASMLAMNGATLAEIAEVLGHRTLQMVKRYAHLTDDHTAELLSRMSDRLFAENDAERTTSESRA